MKVPWEEWDHVLKIDPDKDLPRGVTFDDVCSTGTDAIEIGGTTGITDEKMGEVIDACGTYNVPLYQEPSSPAVVVHHDQLDGYLVPIVLNAVESTWIAGAHKEWVRIDKKIRWDRTWTEAYIVLNPDSAVAQYTAADCELSASDVSAYSTVAERFLGQDIIYIEYSGTFGDSDIVQAARDSLESATLFYGGGIRSYHEAFEMRSCADTIVVGDLLHDHGVDAVEDTVDGARDAGDRNP